MAWVPGSASARHVGNVADRISSARILRERRVVEIDPTMVAVDGDVFQNGAEPARRFVDFRLAGFRKADHFGIATAFEVKDACVAPAVLVVTDQSARGIGGKRRLAGAGQAEENRDIVLVPSVVGRAVHRHYVPLRQEIVHHGENRFLDFACISRAAYEHELLTKVQQHEGFRMRAVDLRIGLKTWRMNDGELSLVRGKFRVLELTDEHRARKERVRRAFGNDADRHTELLVGARVAFLDKNILALQIGEQAGLERIKLLRREGPVYLAPPDPALAGGLADEELVVRRATRVLPRADDEWPEVAQHAFVASDRFLVKGGRGKIPIHSAQVAEPEPAKAFEFFSRNGFHLVGILHAYALEDYTAIVGGCAEFVARALAAHPRQNP